MSRFAWSQDRGVHLPEVDAEHRGLCLLAEDCRKSLRAGAPGVDVKLRALLAEMEDHLSHEERLMRKAGYRMFDWHKGQHDTVRRHVNRDAARFFAGDTSAGTDLLEFLADWLRDHVSVADAMMAAALRNHQRTHI